MDFQSYQKFSKCTKNMLPLKKIRNKLSELLFGSTLQLEK